MSFQYYTKSLEELQEITKVIVNNFGVILGCESDFKTWSPPVACKICDVLTLSGANCSNVSDQYFDPLDGILTYKFTSVVNASMKDIWHSVLNYEESVLSLNKLASVKVSTNLSTKDKFKICANQSTDFDSTLFECIYNIPEMQYTDDYKRILLIMLACFSIRFQIYDFSVGKSSSLDTESLNDSFLNMIIENIKYEKYVLNQSALSISGFENSTDFIEQQLTLLMKNCKQLRMYVLEYLK